MKTLKIIHVSHNRMMTPEMKEVLEYLSKQKDYALFAGFAAFLHANVECSADIDIFLPTKAAVLRYQKDCVNNSWDILHRERGRYDLHFALEKNGTTFDVVYTASSRVFLNTAVKVRWNKFTLNVISKESLLLTKMNQVTSPTRSEDKTRRDRIVIRKLRKEINLKKLRSLVSRVHDIYWREGYA